MPHAATHPHPAPPTGGHACRPPRRVAVHDGPCRDRGVGSRCEPRGFTLLEALIASAVLLLTVLAASMALWSGQRQGEYSQDVVQGTLAAAALMEEVLACEYADMSAYDGRVEAVGALETSTGAAYPPSYFRIARSVSVLPRTHAFGQIGVEVDGLEIVVTTTDVDGTELCRLTRFVPEPQS